MTSISNVLNSDWSDDSDDSDYTDTKSYSSDVSEVSEVSEIIYSSLDDNNNTDEHVENKASKCCIIL